MERYVTARAARICAICGDLEYQSHIITREFWACPKCLDILKQVIKDREEKPQTIYPMNHHD